MSRLRTVWRYGVVGFLWMEWCNLCTTCPDDRQIAIANRLGQLCLLLGVVIGFTAFKVLDS